MSPAAGPNLPPEQPSRIMKFLAKDRNLVLCIILMLFLLTVIFSGTTAKFLEDLADMYAAISTLL